MQLAAFNFIASRPCARARVSSRSSRRSVFFSPTPSCSPAVSRSPLFSLPHFSRFSRFSLLPFRRFRSPIFPLALSLFHFSIVEGKIIYLSVAFLLLSLPLFYLLQRGTVTCRCYIALQATTKTSWQLFVRFTGEMHVSRRKTLPENYAAVASRYIYSRLRRMDNKRSLTKFLCEIKHSSQIMISKSFIPLFV